MGADVSRDELNQWIEAIRSDMRDGFAGVHSRLDHLNGRTRDAEKTIAILQDRQTRDPAARWGVVGTALAAAGTFLYQLLSHR